jgi:hypothetical protein
MLCDVVGGARGAPDRITGGLLCDGWLVFVSSSLFLPSTMLFDLLATKPPSRSGLVFVETSRTVGVATVRAVELGDDATSTGRGSCDEVNMLEIGLFDGGASTSMGEAR